MGYAIEIKNVSHNFEDKKVCDNISINFEENKIYGLLGKNGTGKTTLISIIANQLLAKEGYVKILGSNPKENTNTLEDLCVVKEREYYNPEAKVRDIFKIYSLFFKDYDTKKQEKLCKLFEIKEKTMYKKLSRGMKTTISNIIGLCSNAKITIFDEPTIGLDAVNRRLFYDLLLEAYSQGNRTIILSTHLIDEIEELLEKVVIIKDGKVEVDDYIDNVREKSVYLTGKKDHLSNLSILKNKNPMKSFGNTSIYSYYGEIPECDLDEIKKYGIEVEPMSIQDMFIEMNRKEVI